MPYLMICHHILSPSPNFKLFAMRKLIFLFLITLLFSCENVPHYPQVQNDPIEMESVWQYLKAYSIHQDECILTDSDTCLKRLRDNPFLYTTPEEMMESMCDTLKRQNFTKYRDDCGSGAQADNSTEKKLRSGNTDANNEAQYVDYHQLTDSTALIRITMFETGFAYRQFRGVLPKLPLNCTNCIIDVCDNPGGDLDELDSILELFLPENTSYLLVRKREYDPQTRQYHTVDFRPVKTIRPASPYLSRKKIVVLLNQGSASAAEILATGLKDGCGALLAGNTSYGKAIGQIAISRKGRKSLQITFMQIKSISAGIYQNIGLKPDVYLNNLDIYTDQHALLSVVKLVEPGVKELDLRLGMVLHKNVSSAKPQGYVVRDVQLDKYP
jgi:hypothetical protein